MQRVTVIYVVSRRTPGALGVLLLHYLYLFMAILVNFGEVRLGCSMSEVRYLICQCYVVKRCCDIICDVTVLHMHWSHDHLL